MAKGKKTGGRVAGTPNKVTDSIKNLLNRILPEERLEKNWNYFLNHADPVYRWKAHELANAYLFGKPVMPISGVEDMPPVHIDISAIPMKRKRA
jgi:hypothetical protein